MKIFGHVLLSWIKNEQFLSTLRCHGQKSINSCTRDNGHAQEIAFYCAKK